MWLWCISEQEAFAVRGDLVTPDCHNHVMTCYDKNITGSLSLFVTGVIKCHFVKYVIFNAKLTLMSLSWQLDMIKLEKTVQLHVLIMFYCYMVGFDIGCHKTNKNVPCIFSLISTTVTHFRLLIKFYYTVKCWCYYCYFLGVMNNYLVLKQSGII